MPRLSTVDQIMTEVAGEVGLDPSVSNPKSSQDPNFQQLAVLLNSACQEMVELHPWQILQKQKQYITSSSDSGIYDLPDDFAYMIDQTGWEHTNRFPLGGPLTTQEWNYLAGRDLVSSTIYASFRMITNKFEIYPQPVPDGLDINFSYISRNFAASNLDLEVPSDNITEGGQFLLFEPILIKKFLKAKFLEAKGFDASAARNEFENMFGSRTGKDTGAQILSVGGPRVGYPYLDTYRNTPDTSYGVS